MLCCLDFSVHFCFTRRQNREERCKANGKIYLGTIQEALALAHALFEYGEREHSLTIAEHGLSLEGQRAPLAKWLREQAATMGKTDLALRAAEITYQEENLLARLTEH